MTRYIATPLLSLFVVMVCKSQQTPPLHQPNKVDLLRTDADALALAKESLGQYWEDLEIQQVSKRVIDDLPSRHLNIKSWDRADLDGNGTTDLLMHCGVREGGVICLMDSGANRFAVHWLTRYAFQPAAFAVIDTVDAHPVVRYFQASGYLDGLDAATWNKFTLVYRGGGFVEINDNPDPRTVSRISFSTTGCFGTCPIFDLSIENDRSAILNAKQFNEPDGLFRCVIDTVGYAELVDLIQYVDLRRSLDSYAVSWTDDQACNLIVTYADGTQKTVHDYGLLGSFGLSAIYDSLDRLRRRSEWH